MAAPDGSLGAELHKLRTKRGLTQVQASERAKIGQTTISGYERGEIEPPPAQIRTLLNAYDATDAERAVIGAILAGGPLPAEAERAAS